MKQACGATHLASWGRRAALRVHNRFVFIFSEQVKSMNDVLPATVCSHSCSRKASTLTASPRQPHMPVPMRLADKLSPLENPQSVVQFAHAHPLSPDLHKQPHSTRGKLTAPARAVVVIGHPPTGRDNSRNAVEIGPNNSTA